MKPHPKGARARVLFTSVSGLTRRTTSSAAGPSTRWSFTTTRSRGAQGAFCLRMFHRSCGIMMMQENISAPCTVLDFPTREALVRELSAHDYDIVGISSIIVNVGKVREMCWLIRRRFSRIGHRRGRSRGGHSRN
jgi:hypothetical protein